MRLADKVTIITGGGARSLAVQFGPVGIRTNAICPGPVVDGGTTVNYF